MVILTTERLVLRQWQPDELPTLHTILSHLPTMQFWPAPFTLEQSERWLHRSLEIYSATADTYGRWGVELKDSGNVIGDCGLIQAEVNGIIENDVGYIIHADYWHNGYATEAATAIRDYGFSNLELPRMVANMACDHYSSARVAKAIGMNIETEFLNQRNRGFRTFLYAIEHLYWKQRYLRKSENSGSAPHGA